MAEQKKTGPEKRKTGKKRGRALRRAILLVMAVVVLGGGGWLVVNRLRSEYTVVYQEYTASVGSISNSLSFNGTMQAISNATYTANSSTTVRTIYFAEGAEVKAGDKLIRLSSGQVVEAEFSGRINQLFVSEGEKVAAGASLAQVVDFTHMKVSIRVDEYDISDVHVGTRCRVTTTATEETFECEISSINYVSSSTGNVAYYTATAFVDVSGTVYPGMQVTVTVPQEEASDVVILKAEAISFSRNNQAFVYQQDENGQMTETPVTTGVSNGNYVEITSGLRDGDTVYAVAQKEDAGSGGLLSGLFGGQMVLPGTGTQRQRNNTNWNTNWNNGGQNRAPGGNGR